MGYPFLTYSIGMPDSPTKGTYNTRTCRIVSPTQWKGSYPTLRETDPGKHHIVTRPLDDDNETMC